jgi:hypothetical protein
MTTNDQMRKFKNDLKSADCRDRNEFYRLFNTGMELLRMLDGDVTSEFSVSRPTVNRWRNGKNAPHPLMRQPIYDWFLNRVSQLLRSRQGYSTGPQPVVAMAARSVDD